MAESSLSASRHLRAGAIFLSTEPAWRNAEFRGKDGGKIFRRSTAALAGDLFDRIVLRFQQFNRFAHPAMDYKIRGGHLTPHLIHLQQVAGS